MALKVRTGVTVRPSAVHWVPNQAFALPLYTVSAEAHIRSTEEAAIWIEAAEQCQQPELRLACVSRLVQRLLGKEPGPAALASSIADAAELERIDKGTLLLLLGLVAGSARQLVPREQLLAYTAPSRGDIAASQQQATGVGSFEWRIERFSEQPAQVGSRLMSPTFVAGGREWQLALYPNGVFGSEGYLSGEGLSSGVRICIWLHLRLAVWLSCIATSWPCMPFKSTSPPLRTHPHLQCS